MKILTSQDYELIASCCSCPMPSCPEPRKECESITGHGWLQGYFNEDEPDTWNRIRYGKFKQQYQASNGESGHWYEHVVDPMLEVVVGVVQISTPVYTTTQGGGNAWGLPIERIYSNPMEVEAAAGAMYAMIEAAIDWDNEDMLKQAECQSTKWHNFNWWGGGPAAGADLVATHARYRFGVPEDFSTPEAPRSTWEMQWDEVFFPKEYDDWAWDVHYYREAVAAHEAWEECEALWPGQCGEEPEIPPDPGPAPVEPTVVASRDWTWSGSMNEPWSPWFEIPMPEMEGELRTVNVMVKCYKSTRLGVKPTAHGETYETEP